MDIVNLLLEKLNSWLQAAIKLLPNLALALVILIVFYGIGKLVRKLVSRVLHRVTDNKTIIDLLETIIGVIVVGVGALIALGVLNLSGVVTSFLAGAGVVGLALGFAFQDIASNFISGILLSIRHPFHKGDLIESQGHYGTVKELNLRTTLIKTPQGKTVYIPNKDVFGEPLENYTQDNERRIDLSCGVSYSDDLDLAKRVAIEAVENLEGIDHSRDVEFIYDEFGGSSINFKIRFWVTFKANMDYLEPRSNAIIAIKKKFDENDIDIPWPVRSVEFGVKGGKNLGAMLEDREQSNGEASDAEPNEGRGD